MGYLEERRQDFYSAKLVGAVAAGPIAAALIERQRVSRHLCAGRLVQRAGRRAHPVPAPAHRGAGHAARAGRRGIEDVGARPARPAPPTDSPGGTIAQFHAQLRLLLARGAPAPDRCTTQRRVVYAKIERKIPAVPVGFPAPPRLHRCRHGRRAGKGSHHRLGTKGTGGGK